MKMNYKRFMGLPGMLLAIGLLFVACDNGNGSGGGEIGDPTVSPIEAAFSAMLRANFVSSGDATTVAVITRMNNWGQTDSEYSVTGTKGVIRGYLPNSLELNSSTAVSGSDISIVWGPPNAVGANHYESSWITDDIYYWEDDLYNLDGSLWKSSYDNHLSFQIVSGSDARTVIYPYTVSYPAGSEEQTIKGNLKLNLDRWGK